MAATRVLSWDEVQEAIAQAGIADDPTVQAIVGELRRRSRLTCAQISYLATLIEIAANGRR